MGGGEGGRGVGLQCSEVGKREVCAPLKSLVGELDRKVTDAPGRAEEKMTALKEFQSCMLYFEF